jgi:hypothetical protein
MVEIKITISRTPRGNHLITGGVSAVVDMLPSEHDISVKIRNGLEVLLPLLTEESGYGLEFMLSEQLGPDGGAAEK